MSVMTSATRTSISDMPDWDERLKAYDLSGASVPKIVGSLIYAQLPCLLLGTPVRPILMHRAGTLDDGVDRSIVKFDVATSRPSLPKLSVLAEAELVMTRPLKAPCVPKVLPA